MKREWLCIFTMISLLNVASVACAAGSNPPIVIGAVLPLTGELAKFGEMQKNSYMLALDEINKNGGVRGRKLELLIEDDTGRPEVGRSAVEKLISKDDILILTGGYSSSVTYAIAGVAQNFKVPYVTHTGAADNITEMGWNYVFRINQASSEYFSGVLSFLKNVAKPKTVAVIFENTLFGQSQGKSFAKACENLGCKVMLKEGFESGAVDFKPLLTKLKGADPDLVYAVCYVMDAGLILRQSKELNFMPKLFVGGGGGFALPEFVKNAGPAAEYIYSATLWSESLPFPGAKEYYQNYKKRFNDPPQFVAAQAYVALYVIADALKRSADLSREKIRESLTKTDMDSMYGHVKFISYGKKSQQNRLPSYMGQWQKGKFELVWPAEYSSKSYVYPIPSWSER
ncbi:MAG: ABC transporter substrate-binding protein [Desulfomonilaceae bacterium]